MCLRGILQSLSLSSDKPTSSKSRVTTPPTSSSSTDKESTAAQRLAPLAPLPNSSSSVPGGSQISTIMPPRGSGVRKKSSKASKAKDAGGYFGAGGGAGSSNSSSDGKLDKMFDDLRDSDQDPKDSLGVESTMSYLSGLGLKIDSGEIFVALELVQAPNFGEITRKGFVEGWREAGVSSSKSAHAQHIRQRVSQLSTDAAYFKRVYRYTFVAGKEGDQRALGLENAIEFWKALFSSPGRPWKTASYDWLEMWTEFLNDKWTRSVNRDMWNQALEFANKTMEDETLGFWSEDSAWPSVIDDFVLWCKEKKSVGQKDVMEMDG